jgi:hypothetical protein
MKCSFLAGTVFSGAIGAILLSSGSPSLAQGSATILVQEGFEDSNLGSRGWYDNTGNPVTTAEKYAGTGSLECRFAVGGTNCSGGNLARHSLTGTDSVYIAFYIKYSSNWVGSGKSYHPHMFYFLTNLDGSYVGPAYTHLTAYIEENGGKPLLALQDGMNIDESRVSQNLVNVTEQRSVAGCNGDSDGYGNGECYSAGSVHWNGKKWYAPSVFFDSTPSSSKFKGNWHLVEAYFKLNSIVNGKGATDGILRYWYDGTLIIDRTNVVLRTGAHPSMAFNQFMAAPYIGDGSPVSQSFWVDNLLIATGRPATPPVPPGGTAATPPGAPSNVRIIR